MSTLVHLGTTVISTFGVVSDDGDVVERHDVRVEIAVVGPSSLLAAYEGVARKRRELETGVALRDAVDRTLDDRRDSPCR